MRSLTRAEVERIVTEARESNRVPGLSGYDLSSLDLSGVDLRDADLYHADLRDTDLSGADLTRARLGFANLDGADLTRARLGFANLAGADLTGANLDHTVLHQSDLSDAYWGGLAIDGLPSGRVLHVPTPSGWQLSVGCWHFRTAPELRRLIAGEDGWPGADTPEERARRRPLLAAAADLCDAHAAAHQDVIEALAERWGLDERP